MRILITSGPTREFIDDVRFISNPSSGKMGYECARAAVKRGHCVILVSGPVSIAPPKGVRLIKVVSAEQMYRSVMKYFDKVDAVISSAAVCDYKPGVKTRGKIKKESGVLTVKLKRTRDILKMLGRRKTGQKLVGFALETGDIKKRAFEKLVSKNLDFIVANTPDSFESNYIKPCIIFRDKTIKDFGRIKKAKFADIIIKLLESGHI